MSGLILPALPGLTWNFTRTPVWYTGMQSALSGKSSTVAKRRYPLIRWELNYSVLRDVGAAAYSSSTSEYLQILGLFNAVQARYDSWLYSDPLFHTVTAQQFGTGDGSTTLFAVTAINQNSGGPGYPELIQNFNGTPTFYDNGTPISGGSYTLGPSLSPAVPAGYILFNVAPTTGHALTWSGSFYYRCRFDNDSLPDLKGLMSKLFVLDKLSFTSIKL